MISNGLKQAAELRQIKEQKEELRKRNVMLLILDHLEKQNYIDVANSLWGITGLNKSQYSVADNVDLLDILREFETFFELKYNKPPKLIKKLPEDTKRRPSSITLSAQLKKQERKPPISTPSKKPPPPSETRPQSSTQKSTEDETVEKKSFGILGIPLSQPLDDVKVFEPVTEEVLDNGERLLLKPLALGSALSLNTSDQKDLISIIQRDIFVKNPNVSWNDIVGLDSSKKLLKEAITYPLKYPELFQGIIDPWNGVLLYGMPGCGKTMLAKAVASECKTTFFNISASSIVSKWRGESEKLVRVLFEMARHYAPSTIFLDEIDSIMSSRDVDGEHEGSRRMKTELLIQMDGLARTKDHVFILAASNIPWQLDMALIRRLEKRIFIGMPDFDALVSMLRKHLPVDLVDGFGNQVVSDQLDYRKGAEMLNGYSGSDVKSICKEAIMMPLRLVFEKLSLNSPETRSETDNGKEVKQLQREVVTTDHLLGAISKIRPSCNLKLLKEYEQWAKDFGST